MANFPTGNANEATMVFNTPPSLPIQASGNQCSLLPSCITDWKFSAVLDALKFSDVCAENKYLTNFSSRKLNRGKGVLFSSIPESIVVDWIRALDWDKVMAVNEISYPHLVKLFNSNMVIVTDDSENVCLKSFVLGKELILTIAYVNSLFDLPDEGSKFFSFGEWNTPECTLADFCHIFWEGKTYPFSGGKALNNMFADHFFLHKLIFCTLLSGATTSGGHTTDKNTMSMYLTFMTVHERLVNLGFIVLKYIAYSAVHFSKNLPYGMFLILVFRKENIFLPQSWMEPPKECCIIDLNSLIKMRIQHFETDGWYRGVKKDAKADPIKVSSFADTPPRKRTHNSTSAVPPTCPNITSLQAFLESLHTKIDSQSTIILELKNQVRKLRSQEVPLLMLKREKK
ncbi:hypothetical protein CDL12_26568 [Handroanthus impetiginosus]|uniref:Uncharacterized protein n=1 Tax=Handroanthus impetiginosus TaxID=429701 RepID=A0A2G9G6J5_9LAMI|nr:hypothetical protein CDL12_26568 [Handroanthus impetiginosus]